MTPYDVLVYIGLFMGGAVFGIFIGYLGLRARLPPWVRAAMGARAVAMIFTRGGTVRFAGLEFKAPGIAMAKGMAHIVVIPPGTKSLHLEKGGEMYVAAETSTHYSYAHSALTRESIFVAHVLPASCTQGDLGDPQCLDELAKQVGQVSEQLPVGPLAVSIAADWEKLQNHVVDTSAQLLSSALSAVSTVAQSQSEAKSLILEIAKLNKAAVRGMMKWVLIIVLVVAIAFGIISIIAREAP